MAGRGFDHAGGVQKGDQMRRPPAGDQGGQMGQAADNDAHDDPVTPYHGRVRCCQILPPQTEGGNAPRIAAEPGKQVRDLCEGYSFPAGRQKDQGLGSAEARQLGGLEKGAGPVSGLDQFLDHDRGAAGRPNRMWMADSRRSSNRR